MEAAVIYETRYFLINDCAYVSRCILNLADQEWKNVFPQWPQAKPDCAFERRPVLKGFRGDIIVVELSESHVIERYLAHKFGFLVDQAADPAALAVADMLTGQLNGASESMCDFIMDLQNSAKKEAMYTKIAFVLTWHGRVLAAAGTAFYSSNTKMRLADPALHFLYKFLLQIGEHTDFDDLEFLHAMNLIKAVGANEKIISVVN
ncbi:putative glutathione S-transferase 7 [Smittium culicis]|uniref:Putative glutathione S-transferase 7 n=1 Tax=Smittium culicis TaxID=133412 RepID=A0A1R1XJF7_9FUNG|nr:putative glutathione S-transferase 7 [Smittium culicis]